MKSQFPIVVFIAPGRCEGAKAGCILPYMVGQEQEQRKIPRAIAGERDGNEELNTGKRKRICVTWTNSNLVGCLPPA